MTHPRSVPIIPDKVTIITDADPSLLLELASSLTPEDDGKLGEKKAT